MSGGEKELEIRRMMQQFSHQISEMNSRCISEMAGDITRNDFLELAKSISVLRGKYLRDALQVARAEDHQLIGQLCVELKKDRLAYEEAMKAFDELKHALQRGYFNLADE